ncbi:putative inositol monophosphatase [Actinacidiphila reveromycinica]|uniref:Putative inositol monophosphatase n=1 Tax=Actinacidiphila reveromycinica TaxID=659352 RepID=A0A7U3UYL4_9ACTN|nr:inositol monophosphatase [Streptomyces sp. SN-593]BBB00969.1 putative inositol monophosphatase [Streptomyces sp. SN-593]
MGNDAGVVGPAPDDAFMAVVEETVRDVVAAEVTPRWRRLAAGDIVEKHGPHDLVTTADRRAEEALTERLPALLPGSVVVGEEAVAADPSLLELLRGDAPVWVVDPVDGTSAFVRGDEGFSTLVSLVRGGEPVASWTYAPQLGLFATARRGQGAYLDGERLRTAADREPLRIWISNPVFRHDEERAALARLEQAGVETVPCTTSAGLAYLEVARGIADGVAFFWEAPWDHSAGLLLVSEAGGASLTPAGEPFRVPGGNRLPFTVARDAATARRVMSTLGVGFAADARGTERAEAAGREGGTR